MLVLAVCNHIHCIFTIYTVIYNTIYTYIATHIDMITHTLIYVIYICLYMYYSLRSLDEVPCHLPSVFDERAKALKCPIDLKAGILLAGHTSTSLKTALRGISQYTSTWKC